MGNAIQNLIDEARLHVTVADIVEFSFDDPGYADYVRVWSEILKTGYVPSKNKLRGISFLNCFELTESINLANFDRLKWQQDPARFQSYRILTNAVGLVMAANGLAGDVMCPSYSMANLLYDSMALQRRSTLELLCPAFLELHDELIRHESQEGPIVLVAQLIIGFMGYGDRLRLNELAERIIDDDSSYRKRYETDARDFIWGQIGDLSRDVWVELIERYYPHEQSDNTLALLRETLLDSVQG
jgi:hypothetical protein